MICECASRPRKTSSRALSSTSRDRRTARPKKTLTVINAPCTASRLTPRLVRLAPQPSRISTARRPSPTAFLRLSESIDLHRVEPREVGVPTTVVAIAEDRLVPLEDLFALSEALPRGEIHVLRSKFGHDAFLTETRAIGDLIVGALDAALQGACGGAA